MVFCWFAKNKHFKRKANQSGQIMPFLLVIIAIFLGAFYSTYQIGKVAMDMTCVDNAADACSLAAASHMAYVLNLVHQRMAGLKTAFDSFQSSLKSLSKTTDISLVRAQNNIKKAQAKIGYAQSDALPGGICRIWSGADSAQVNLNDAYRLIEDAKKLIKSADSIVKEKENLVEDYSISANDTLCDMIKEVKVRYDYAKLDGVRYALENNCVYPLLSSKQQADIDKGINEKYKKMAKEVDSSERYKPEASEAHNYNWTDSKGNDHSMAASVTLPKIASIELEVTERNIPCGPQGPKSAAKSAESDPYGFKDYKLLGTMLNDIAQELKSCKEEEKSIYLGTISAAIRCKNPDTNPFAVIQYGQFGNRANSVIDKLAASLNKLNTIVSPTVTALIKHNKELFKSMGAKAGKRIVSSSGSHCANAEDVIIIGVDDVKFESGCIGCDVNIGGSSSGISASAFGGGSTRVSQPNKHYIPKILSNNGSCPGNGGSSIGSPSGSGFNHKDKSPCK